MKALISNLKYIIKSDRFLIVTLGLIAVWFIFYPHNRYDGWFVTNTLRLDINGYEKYSTFLSFPVGIITILLVYLTYRSQKEELRNTNQALRLQNNTSLQQQFDSVFFKLIELKLELSSNLTYRDYGTDIPRRGLDVFEKINKTEINNISKHVFNSTRHSAEDLIKTINYILNKTNSLVSYMRLLNHTINYIKSTFPTDDDKKNNYINILFSTLTHDEILFIYYYFYSKDINKLNYINFHEFIKPENLHDKIFWVYVD